MGKGGNSRPIPPGHRPPPHTPKPAGTTTRHQLHCPQAGQAHASAPSAHTPKDSLGHTANGSWPRQSWTRGFFPGVTSAHNVPGLETESNCLWHKLHNPEGGPAGSDATCQPKQPVPTPCRVLPHRCGLTTHLLRGPESAASTKSPVPSQHTGAHMGSHRPRACPLLRHPHLSRHAVRQRDSGVPAWTPALDPEVSAASLSLQTTQDTPLRSTPTGALSEQVRSPSALPFSPSSSDRVQSWRQVPLGQTLHRGPDWEKAAWIQEYWPQTQSKRRARQTGPGRQAQPRAHGPHCYVPSDFTCVCPQVAQRKCLTYSGFLPSHGPLLFSGNKTSKEKCFLVFNLFKKKKKIRAGASTVSDGRSHSGGNIPRHSLCPKGHSILSLSQCLGMPGRGGPLLRLGLPRGRDPSPLPPMRLSSRRETASSHKPRVGRAGWGWESEEVMASESGHHVAAVRGPQPRGPILESLPPCTQGSFPPPQVPGSPLPAASPRQQGYQASKDDLGLSGPQGWPCCLLGLPLSLRAHGSQVLLF